MKIVQSSVFRVPHGSKTEKAIIENVEANHKASKAWSDFAEKHGATQLYGGTSLQGLVFGGDTNPPKNWMRPDKRVKAYRPKLNGKMTDDAFEFKCLPKKPDLIGWLYSLGLDVVVNDGRFKTPGYTKISDTYYLTAAPGCPIPDDVIPATEEESEEVNSK